MYLVTDGSGREFAMKQFKKGKSQAKLKHEVEMGNQAAAVGVGPSIVAYDLSLGRIVMEKMASTLPDLVRKQGGESWLESFVG